MHSALPCSFSLVKRVKEQPHQRVICESQWGSRLAPLRNGARLNRKALERP